MTEKKIGLAELIAYAEAINSGEEISDTINRQEAARCMRAAISELCGWIELLAAASKKLDGVEVRHDH